MKGSVLEAKVVGGSRGVVEKRREPRAERKKERPVAGTQETTK